jgi:hypothetical protein
MKLDRIARTGDQQPAFEAVFKMDDGKQKTVKFGTRQNRIHCPSCRS